LTITKKNIYILKYIFMFLDKTLQLWQTNSISMTLSNNITCFNNFYWLCIPLWYCIFKFSNVFKHNRYLKHRHSRFMIQYIYLFFFHFTLAIRKTTFNLYNFILTTIFIKQLTILFLLIFYWKLCITLDTLTCLHNILWLYTTVQVV